MKTGPATTRQLTAARIAAERRARQLTLKQLGALVGVTDACISRWETGQSFPRPHLLVKLAEVLGLSVDDLMGVPLRTSASEVILAARTQVASALKIDVRRVRVEIDP